MNKEKIANWEKSLENITELHKRIKHLDKSLEQLHPIAIVKENVFYIFDIESDKYTFIKQHQIPNMQLPDKILASFPLDFYDNKPAAVVSEDALSSLEKQVFIFHEFVHCYQFLNGEQTIKKQLNIYKKYQKENDMMWEINHPFGYDDNNFINKTLELIGDYADNSRDKIENFYKYLKLNLCEFDYEYLIWQEFKEGYARYIENNIREFLNLDLNDRTPEPPFSRPVFYWTGSRHINFIKNTLQKEFNSIEELFELMI